MTFGVSPMLKQKLYVFLLKKAQLGKFQDEKLANV
jgi:hypothetical protein